MEGVLFSLTIYLQRLYYPIVSLGSLYVSLKSIMPIVYKLLDVLENEKEIKSGRYYPTIQLQGHIDMRNIYFKYEDSSCYIFKGFDLETLLYNFINDTPVS